jgi:predicted  nucleic acid-binding Zn-ribbon protein
MSKDEKRKVELQAVAEKFRMLCNMRIEELEDRIPGITNLLEKDALLKEIDALHELADKANEEAEHLIEEYYKNKKGSDEL